MPSFSSDSNGGLNVREQRHLQSVALTIMQGCISLIPFNSSSFTLSIRTQEKLTKSAREAFLNLEHSFYGQYPQLLDPPTPHSYAVHRKLKQGSTFVITSQSPG